MKRFLPFFLMFFLLTSCASKTTTEYAEEIIMFYDGVSSFDCESVIYADYYDFVTEYRVEFEYNSGNSCVKIVEPADIAGFTVEFDDGLYRILYDDANLELLTLGNSDISPAEMLSRLVYQWKNGYMTECAAVIKDGVECIMISFSQNNGEMMYYTYFEKENFKPVCAEITYNGKKILTCNFESVSFAD